MVGREDWGSKQAVMYALAEYLSLGKMREACRRVSPHFQKYSGTQGSERLRSNLRLVLNRARKEPSYLEEVREELSNLGQLGCLITEDYRDGHKAS